MAARSLSKAGSWWRSGNWPLCHRLGRSRSRCLSTQDAASGDPSSQSVRLPAVLDDAIEPTVPTGPAALRYKRPKVITILAANRPGTIAQISQMLSFVGVNIESLVLGRTDVPELCRITITCNPTDENLKKITRKLEKLVCVALFNLVDTQDSVPAASKESELEREEEIVERVLLMAKLRVPKAAADKKDFISLANRYQASILHTEGRDGSRFVIMCVSKPQEMHKFIESLKQYDIIELNRSGIVTMNSTQSTLRRSFDSSRNFVRGQEHLEATGGREEGSEDEETRETMEATSTNPIDSGAGQNRSRDKKKPVIKARVFSRNLLLKHPPGSRIYLLPETSQTISTPLLQSAAQSSDAVPSSSPTTSFSSVDDATIMITTEKMYTRSDGTYTPERLSLHERIANQLFHSYPQGLAKPEMLLLIGTPGAGKNTVLLSTLLPSVLKYKSIRNYVNLDVDDCLAMLPEYYHPVLDIGLGRHGPPQEELLVPLPTTAFADRDPHTRYAMCRDEAKFIIRKNRDAAIMARKNIIVHSTGKDSSELMRLIRQVKATGYVIHLCCVDVPTEVAIERVKCRSNIYGRDVPEDVVQYAAASLVPNFTRMARVVDNIYLYDNTVRPPKLVWSQLGGRSTAWDPRHRLISKYHLR